MSKAKANRKAKLSKNKETTREFLQVGTSLRHMHADVHQSHMGVPVLL